jgi:hypothetical protein
VGVLGGDLPGEGQRIVVGVVADPGGEPERDRLGARHHAPGEGELLGHVQPDEPGQHLCPGHVGGEAPTDLEHGELGVGGDDPDVARQRDLAAATQGDAVDRHDHRRRHLGPHVGGLLTRIGDPVGPVARDGQARAVARHGLEAAEVETGAEPAARTRQHHCPHRRVRLQLLTGLDQGLKHGPVERVDLLGPVQADVGHPVLDADDDPIRHGDLPA